MISKFTKLGSLCDILAEAIMLYKKHHQGAYPKQIELHPNLYNTFRNELLDAALYNFTPGIEDLKDINFHGVKVLSVWDAEYPRIITHLNEVDYL